MKKSDVMVVHKTSRDWTEADLWGGNDFAFASQDDLDEVFGIEPKVVDHFFDHMKMGELKGKGPLESGPCNFVGLSSPLIERAGLRRRVENVLSKSNIVILGGAAGSGKSDFLLHEIAERKRTGLCTIVDCNSLRMKSTMILQREALWALFGDDEEGFRQFIGSFPNNPLLEFLRLRHQRGGVVLFDNLHRLYGSFSKEPSEIETLLREIVQLGAELRMGIVFSCKTVSATGMPFSRLIGGMPIVVASNLDIGEIDNWFGNAVFKRHVAAGLTSRDVLRVTGGVYSILKDLGRFLVFCSATGRLALRHFVERYTNEYNSFCAHLLRVIRRYPEVDFDFNRIVDIETRNELLSTGALIERAGDLVFSSPMISRRFGYLVRPKNLTIALADGTMERLAKNSRIPELIGDAYARRLLHIMEYKSILKELHNLLLVQGFSGEYFIRDRYNMKLWARYHLSHGMLQAFLPLNVDERPDFVTCVQSGWPNVAEDGVLYLPVIGKLGYVEFVVKSLVPKKFLGKPFVMRKLRHIVDELRPMLLFAIDEILQSAYQREQDRVFRRIDDLKERPESNLMMEIMRLADCSVVAELRRSNSGWNCTRYETVELQVDEAATFDSSIFQYASDDMLDEMAAYRGRRGLIVSGSKLRRLFPVMFARDKSATLFIKPFGNDRINLSAKDRKGKSNQMSMSSQMVLFAFTKEECVHGFGGLQQRNLEIYASLAAC